MAHATAAKSTAKYIASVLEGLEDIRDRSLGRRLQAISPAARRAEGRIFLSTDAILREAHQKNHGRGGALRRPRG